MIEKPTHVEPSRPVAAEKPSANGSHHPILRGRPRLTPMLAFRRAYCNFDWLRRAHQQSPVSLGALTESN